MEDYAPTAIAIGDTLYFLASSHVQSDIYKSADPAGGHWEIARKKLEVAMWDPAFFLDDDNRLYVYWGCSNVTPIYGVELDYNNNFDFIGEPVELIHQNPAEHGWEVPGDYNTLKDRTPWIEGAWMNKRNGKYYLQYAGPGTEFKSYSDGVYVSENPLGPFELQPHNPFAYKPEGFTAGAGHGSTFEDRYGNFWHIGTISISVKHMFERRLGLFPVFFDDQGTMYSVTKYGDFPVIIPERKINNFEDIFPGWMLLSYGKKVEVSSFVDSLPAENMTDENIRTWWSAQSGNPGEYALIDLGESMDVRAIQINFAEHNSTLTGRKEGAIRQYTIEGSVDRQSWSMLADKSKVNTDNAHETIQLPGKTVCRYLKLTNVRVPDGCFAVSGFRVFGTGNGELPGEITGLKAERNPSDKRSVTLSWNPSEGATGYNISYGIEKDKLYQNYMIYGDTSVTINSLHSGLEYYFSIEAFNENGITQSNQVVQSK